MTKKTAGITIVNNNYIHFAVVLAESFLCHNPECDFFIFAIDEISELSRKNMDSRVRIVLIDELLVRDITHRRFYYEITELSTSVKPDCLEYILNTGYDRVYYIDPDIYFYDSIKYLNLLLDKNNILLTPHSVTPIYDGKQPDDLSFLRAGSYNLGFIGLSSSDETLRMLHWWKTRLKTNSFNAFSRGMFTDQKWADLIPSYFEGVVIAKSVGCNVAYWNLHQRKIDRKFGEYLINGEPLVFFHFSGFNVEMSYLSKHTDRYATYFQLGIHAISLFEHYKKKIRSIKNLSKSDGHYVYDFYSDGDKITPLDRMLYFHFYISGGRIEDPFSITREEFFNRINLAKNEKLLEFSQDSRVAKLIRRIENMPKLVKLILRSIIKIQKISDMIGKINNGINKINISEIIYPLFRTKKASK